MGVPSFAPVTCGTAVVGQMVTPVIAEEELVVNDQLTGVMVWPRGSVAPVIVAVYCVDVFRARSGVNVVVAVVAS